MNLITITFSAYDSFRKSFVPLFEPVSIDDLTDANINTIISSGTSATGWCDAESSVPDAVSEMNQIKKMLNWKGEVLVSQYTSERNGKETSGYSVNLQRQASRSLGIVAFRERLAGLVR
tara:strand:+ start:217 stop:573 length:357 start_codon:yes stop_codon:yes gene_type:complete